MLKFCLIWDLGINLFTRGDKSNKMCISLNLKQCLIQVLEVKHNLFACYSICFVFIMTSKPSKLTLRLILEKNKSNDTNFLDWERNLRIILRFEGQEDVLENPIPVLTSFSIVEEKAVAQEKAKVSECHTSYAYCHGTCTSKEI